MLGAHPTVTVIWATAEPHPGVLSASDHSVRKGQKFDVVHHKTKIKPAAQQRKWQESAAEVDNPTTGEMGGLGQTFIYIYYNLYIYIL